MIVEEITRRVIGRQPVAMQQKIVDFVGKHELLDLHALFAEPSDKEMREVALLMAKVRSMQQAIEVLGKPDQTIKAPRTAQENGKSAYKSHHRYSSRWKTLDLTVRERADGSIDSAFTGKYKGEPSQSAKKAKRLS